jgi:hypothetical protein
MVKPENLARHSRKAHSGKEISVPISALMG